MFCIIDTTIEEELGLKQVCDELLRLAHDEIIQKSTWSEEDKEMHRKCICVMRASACGFPEEEKFVEQVDNWLKSLKDRVQPKPKQKWSEENEDIIRLSIENLTELEDRYGKEYGKVGDCIDWLKSLRDRCMPQQKPEWNEEDEKNLQTIQINVDRCMGKWHCCGEVCPISECMSWLKSIKGRVQPKQKWSEEDEYTIERLLCLLDNEQDNYPQLSCDFQEIEGIKEWLKSLRPRSNQEVDEQIETIAMHLDNCGNTAMAEILRSCNLRPKKQWKPTLQQINALSIAVKNGHTPDINALEELLEQLKAL